MARVSQEAKLIARQYSNERILGVPTRSIPVAFVPEAEKAKEKRPSLLASLSRSSSTRSTSKKSASAQTPFTSSSSKTSSQSSTSHRQTMSSPRTARVDSTRTPPPPKPSLPTASPRPAPVSITMNDRARYYDILDIDPDPTFIELKHHSTVLKILSNRKRIMQLSVHPDLSRSADAVERSTAVNRAFDALKTRTCLPLMLQSAKGADHLVEGRQRYQRNEMD